MQDEVRARAQNSQISKNKSPADANIFFETIANAYVLIILKCRRQKNGKFQGFFQGGIILQIVIRPINIIPRNLACFRPRARLVSGFH